MTETDTPLVWRAGRMLIDGDWIHSGDGREIEASSPATGAALGRFALGTRADVDAAVASATTAWPGWASLSAFDRARALKRVGEAIDRRRHELALLVTLDQGKPLHAEAYAEVDEAIAYLEMAAADAVRLDGSMPPSVDGSKRVLLYRVPRGVVGTITPWNWPYATAAALIAPALAAGNGVVWVPSPWTALSSLAFAECFVEADLPRGLVNVVTGEGPIVGDELAGHSGVQAVAFIGSTRTGGSVAARAAGKMTLLELGGNGPVVVLDDADLERAARASLASAFLCAGQSCTAGELFLVHDAVHAQFIELLLEAVRDNVRLGDPRHRETTLGPVNNEEVAAKVDRHLEDAVRLGASVVLGGQRASGFPTDLYYEPTILDGVRLDMVVATEETFGPVIPIMRVKEEQQALEIANSSEYGLLASVWTRDLRRGLRFAEAIHRGWVNVNESSNHWEIHLPFGGRAGSASGVGRDNGRYAIEAFSEPKTVLIDLG